MDRLKALATFKTVVEKGGFSRAAADLDLSCAQVTRAVQDLEQQLGVRLLQRSTRHVSLTAVGQDVLHRAAVLLDGYAELAALGRLSATRVSGTIRLAAPSSVGRWLVSKALVGFMGQHPGVRVDLRLVDGPLDLCQAEDDLALCLSRDLRPSLIAREIASCEVGLYASPTYLGRAGEPRSLAELAAHACLGSDEGRAGGWRLGRCGESDPAPVPVQTSLDTGNTDLLLDAAEHGAGIALLPTFVVGNALCSRRLQRVLPDWQGEPMVLHVAYRSRDNQPLGVRRLIDHLVVSLGGDAEDHEPPVRLAPAVALPLRLHPLAARAMAA